MNNPANQIMVAGNPEKKISGYLWFLFAICFLGNVLGGTASTLMSVYLPVALKDLVGQVDSEQVNHIGATISGLYIIGWAVGGLSWGVISDRIGRGKSLAMSIGMFGLFTVLIGYASSWEWVVVCRLLAGLGVGGMLVINSTLLSEDWPAKSRAVIIGIASIGFPVGIFSSGAVNYFVSGWRQGFMTGLLPLVIGVIAFWTLQESEQWKVSRKNSQASHPANDKISYRKDLLNGSIIFGSMLIGLWAIFSWVPTWVQTLLINSDGQRERSLSMMLLGAGGLTGGFFSGWIANALGIRKAMLMCFAGCFILSFLLFKMNITLTGITLVEITLLSFTFGISQGLLSVYIPLLFPVPVRATATGVCFNIGRFFTAAAVFFVGSLVTVLGGYGNSLLIFSLVFVLGFVILYFQKISPTNQITKSTNHQITK